MHELSLARALVELAAEHAARAGAVRVTRLIGRIGALRQIDDALIQEAFDVAREGTVCAAAALEIERVPLRAHCAQCRHEFVVENWRWNCPECQRVGAPLPGGDELELVSIEAERC